MGAGRSCGGPGEAVRTLFSCQRLTPTCEGPAVATRGQEPGSVAAEVALPPPRAPLLPLVVGRESRHQHPLPEVNRSKGFPCKAESSRHSLLRLSHSDARRFPARRGAFVFFYVYIFCHLLTPGLELKLNKVVVKYQQKGDRDVFIHSALWVLRLGSRVSFVHSSLPPWSLHDK